jgi:hypothetical protein
VRRGQGSVDAGGGEPVEGGGGLVDLASEGGAGHRFPPERGSLQSLLSVHRRLGVERGDGDLDDPGMLPVGSCVCGVVLLIESVRGGFPMRATSWVLGASLLLLFAVGAAADEKTGVNEDGFIQHWLVLAPIPLEMNQTGADAVDKEQIKGEAKLKPKSGAKVKVGDKQLAWKQHVCKEHLLDFNDFLGGQTEDSVAYAVSFIVAPEDLKGVKMKTGSDDQAKVYLNGKEVFKHTEARALEKDQDTTEVTLKKGVNVLVVKVVNEKIDWSFCVRFMDKDDKPLIKLKSKSAE